MLPVRIILLYFLLSQLSYFQHRVKYLVTRYLSFFVSVNISQMQLSLFFSPSVCHLFTWILHFLSRLTFYTLKDRFSRFSLKQHLAHVLEAQHKELLVLSPLWKICHQQPLNFTISTRQLEISPKVCSLPALNGVSELRILPCTCPCNCLL